MKVYVAGPYTQGDPVLNVRAAVEAADAIIEAGHVPYVPHLSMLWHLISPRPVDFWYGYDLLWLQECDAVLRIVGDSTGADNEVKEAERIGLPIYHSIGELP